MTQIIKALVEGISEKKGHTAPAPDADLYDLGILDSLDVFSLITELETLMEIQVDFENVTADSFRSVESIEKFVKEHKE